MQALLSWVMVSMWFIVNNRLLTTRQAYTPNPPSPLSFVSWRLPLITSLQEV